MFTRDHCLYMDHDYDGGVPPFFTTGFKLLARVTLYLNEKTLVYLLGAA